MIFCAFFTVDSLCAITIDVLLSINFINASWTSFSDLESRDDVASSKIKIGDFEIIARAIAIRCFWPPDRFTPLSEGKTSFTEGAISKEDPYGDISNLGQRVDRTYGKFLSNLKPEDAAKTRESLIRGAGRERDYALGYMNARARGRTDEQAAITGRKFAGYDLSPAVKPL
mgnify:CR=1 FL=1